ncbi:MAG: WXG100 family type VII secretion target, partial [Firmicutes bacterium HGW-Firmicutes-3]
LAPKFNNYREIIESYARFLDTTVASYRETETMINNNANAFK